MGWRKDFMLRSILTRSSREARCSYDTARASGASFCPRSEIRHLCMRDRRVLPGGE
jgi:hypothetical protein